MLQTYFKIAFRNLLRNRGFSLINILGLAIGMACTLLILLWVYNERNWDSSQENYGSVYHVRCNRNFNGTINTGEDMMFPLAAAARASFPEVEKAAIVSFDQTTLFSVGEKRLNKSTLAISPEFFSVFTYPAIEGDAAAAAKDPDAILITESTARALFGSTNVLNRPVEINNRRTAYVKAVLKDVPANSTLRFEGLVPFNPSSPDIKAAQTDWVNCGNRVFLKTAANTNVPALEKKLLQLVRENSPSANPSTKGSVVLHPMSRWRLYGEFTDGVNTGGRIAYVRLFTWIAIVILLIACINFMNLSTARSEKRAKEVGVRKTLGSERRQLLGQFLTESVVVSVLAFCVAAVIVVVLLPAFGSLLNEPIAVPYSNPMTWLLAGGVVLATGLLAGSYPALYLSRFNPVKVLKGTFLPGRQGLLPRKVLVTTQFVASIVLLTATLVIFQQLQHVKNRDLGYDQNNLLVVNANTATDKSYDALKNDLLQTGLVSAVNRTAFPLTNIYMSTAGVRWKGMPSDANLVIGFTFTDADFVRTIGARLLSGRDFRMGDSNTVLFNRAAIETMGLKDPVGRTIQWAGKERTIIGIIDNMVMTSPYQPSEPVMVGYGDQRFGRINVRLAKGVNVQKALTAIEGVYRSYSPAYPFEYKFVDDDFAQKFSEQQLIGKLSVGFAGLAIFICCLGLFGLVASSIERRQKELGIRKVLGATGRSLLLLMSREFLVLVALAFLVAVPMAWWAMNKWLQDFAYRIDLGAGVFALVGLVIIAIAFGTVGLNASRAAIKSPVRALRNE